MHIELKSRCLFTLVITKRSMPASLYMFPICFHCHRHPHCAIVQIRLSEASLNESATGNSRLLQRTVSNTRPADEDADGDANAAATTCATPPIAISGTTNASLNGSTSAEGAQTQHNGEHLAVTSRSYSCPSASLSDRSRRPTFESHTSCTEPIGEDDGEAPIVFEIGDALVEQFVAPNGSDTAAVDGQKACSNCVGLRDRHVTPDCCLLSLMLIKLVQSSLIHTL